MVACMCVHDLPNRDGNFRWENHVHSEYGFMTFLTGMETILKESDDENNETVHDLPNRDGNMNRLKSCWVRVPGS